MEPASNASAGGHAGRLAAAAGVGIALAWPAAAGGTVAPAPWEEAGASQAAVPGEVLVRYSARSSAATRHAARSSAGAEGASRLPLPRLELLELGTDRSVRAAVRRLERRPGVLYAEPNYVRRFHDIPDDPLFDQLWGLHNTGAGHWLPDADIDAPEAWDVTVGSQDVVVGLIDSGVNHQHPDLVSKIWANPGETGAGRETNGVDDDGNGFVDDFRGWDFSRDDGTPEGDNDPMDVLGHGTHTGGTVAAAGDNSIGVVGVGRATALMPLKTGDFSVSAAQSVQAVRYADRMGADVVNMSFGGWRPSFAEQDAIKAAEGVLFAISAGNDDSDNDQRPVYPCNYAARNITCVAASTAGDTLAEFSNVGARSVDLAAPGADILSTAWRPVLEPRLDEPFSRPLRGRWRSEGPGDRWGIVKTRRRIKIPFPVPEPIHIVHSALSDSPEGRYENNANTSISSPEVDLTDGESCQLSYRIRGALEREYDRLLVEGSDGSGWGELASYTGRVIGGEREGVSLAEFDGAPSFQVRFRLTSDPSGRADGVKIDDVRVACRSRYFRLSGTSMAAPHVAGAASLVAERFPAAKPVELRARLLAGVDRKPAFRGRVASDGRLNIARSLTHEDTRPPNTTFRDIKTLGPRLRVRLRSTEPLSHFRCKLDDEPWAACGRLHKTPPLPTGNHRLAAAAIDFFGNQDATPAGVGFRVRR